MTHTPLFTLSREDVYDYLRCPKIVSIKAFRALTAPTEEKNKDRRPSLARVIGVIGEAATLAIFALLPRGEERNITSPLQRTRRLLSQMRIQLDAEMQDLLERTVEGLIHVRKYLTEEYGDIRIIGKGQSRNGPMPGQALPDFVAISPKHNVPILIEVKNTMRPSPASDRFQAAYYNTLAKEVGVVVLEERLESDRLTLTPKSFYETVTETIVVYPRLKRYDRVCITVDLRRETIEEIWRAKQLGYMGMSPHVDCDVTCPHRKLSQKLGIELPEGNTETVPPLPLIYAQGLVECGADLDGKYVRDFLSRIGISSILFGTIFDLKEAGKPVSTEVQKKVLELVMHRTGIPTGMIENLFVRRSSWPDAKSILRAIAGEIEPWQRLLGKERIQRSINNIQGLATRLYTLPEESYRFVRQSWKKWRAG